jgi:sialate O-acetylesterase
MRLVLLACFAVLAVALRAELACAPVFGDHMVLQRDLPVPIWGTATPGDLIAVRFAGQEKVATADAAGRWLVRLDPLSAAADPRELTITARNPKSEIENRKFQDVLVGEVWFCSGQSNMEKPLGPRSGQKPTDDYEAELTRADCPTLRLFQVPHHARARAGDGTMQWHPCGADALMQTKFSAAAYYFGRELQRELGVPVGLIHASFGGTRIEAWMPPEAFAADPALRDLPGRTYQAWVKGVQATELYGSMVAPFAPFALRGFLWYQGEANVMNAEHREYAVKQRALIRAWRDAWGRPDAPFYCAQLAPFNYSRQKNWEKQLTPLALPAVWEAQVESLDVPHTGIIPTSDLVADLRDIHPTNKRDVGLRFARLALVDAYGRDIAGQAPRVQAVERAGPASFLVGFAHAAGLRTTGPLESPRYFEIAGSDRVFHPADATIVGNKIEVYSPVVAEPVALRFAWDEAATPNLVNAAGLPALPFRTDDWPLVLDVPKEAK